MRGACARRALAYDDEEWMAVDEPDVLASSLPSWEVWRGT